MSTTSNATWQDSIISAIISHMDLKMVNCRSIVWERRPIRTRGKSLSTIDHHVQDWDTFILDDSLFSMLHRILIKPLINLKMEKTI